MSKSFKKNGSLVKIFEKMKMGRLILKSKAVLLLSSKNNLYYHIVYGDAGIQTYRIAIKYFFNISY